MSTWRSTTPTSPPLRTPVVGQPLGVLDEAGHPLAVGAQHHPAAPRLHFAGYTNPLTGVLRQAGIEARAIAHALQRGNTRATLRTPQLGDRTADALNKGHAPS